MKVITKKCRMCNKSFITSSILSDICSECFDDATKIKKIKIQVEEVNVSKICYDLGLITGRITALFYALLDAVSESEDIKALESAVENNIAFLHNTANYILTYTMNKEKKQ